MSRTLVTGTQILNNSVVRAEINTITTGNALITKLVAGINVTITSTGADIGTGDVTINASGNTSLLSVFGRTGVVVKATGDYNFTDFAGLLSINQMPALTGDATSLSGTTLTTLATVNANVGTFNSFTVNAKGLITAASLVTSLISPPLSATALTSYNDNSSYYASATTANGFPINGTLTGSRFGTVGTQRIHNATGSNQYNRSWDSVAVAWRAWFNTVDNAEYTSTGFLLVGSAVNAYTGLVVGADGLVLTANSTTATGLSWSAVTLAGGGTGAITAAAALTSLGGAPLVSPNFSGGASCPTAPAGDISQTFANTSFIQRATNSNYTLTLPASGNVTLTAAQYLVPVIVLTGAITAAVSVSFSNTGSWCVINNSTGGFAVTLNTVSGTGIIIAQGTTRAIIADGTNVQPANTDFASSSVVVIGGTTRQMQWNNAGVIAGTTLLEASAQGNIVCVDNGVDPTVSTTGATYYSKKTGGKTLWYQQDTLGTVVSHQLALSNTKANLWAHNGNSALLTAPNVTSYGFNMLTVGTPTARNITLDFIGQNKRIYLLSAATAGSSVEIYNSFADYGMGNINTVYSNSVFKLGGFYSVFRCIVNDTTTVAGRTFIGFANSSYGNVASAFPNQSFLTIGNSTAFVGISCDAGDTVYSIGSSDGGTLSGTATHIGYTKTTLPNPVPCTGTTYNGQYILDVRFYSPPGSSNLYYYFKADNITTAPLSIINQGLLTVSLPLGGFHSLVPRIWRNNATNANAVGIEVLSMYIETMY